MEHKMIVVEKYDDGVERHECDTCDLVVFARPGHIQIVQAGDPEVSHGNAIIPVDDLRLDVSVTSRAKKI